MSKVSIKPLADRVVIEPLAAEEKNRRRNYYSRYCKRKTTAWNCSSSWSRQKDEPITVKVGDAVLYGKYAGTEISIDNKDYLIMRESDIVAII